jgi:hypothetical protein
MTQNIRSSTTGSVTRSPTPAVALSGFLQIVRKTGAKVIDPFEDLCSEDLCPALFVDGMPIYKAYDHLSDNAVIKHVNYLDALLAPEAAHSSALHDVVRQVKSGRRRLTRLLKA